MGPLLAIPNVSEGRDAAAVAAIGAAYVAGGARLLDTHADPDHHRAVHTLAAGPGALADAVVLGAHEAVARIDLRRERGIHPHVGAIDVAPVVFLDDARRSPPRPPARLLPRRPPPQPGVRRGAHAGGAAGRRGRPAGLPLRAAVGP